MGGIGLVSLLKAKITNEDKEKKEEEPSKVEDWVSKNHDQNPREFDANQDNVKTDDTEYQVDIDQFLTRSQVNYLKHYEEIVDLRTFELKGKQVEIIQMESHSDIYYLTFVVFKNINNNILHRELVVRCLMTFLA